MKKLFLIVAITTTLAACTSNGNPRAGIFNSLACGGEVEGYTPVDVEYGDSFLRIKAKSKLWRQTEFRVRLKPKSHRDDPVNYENVKVTISGKSTDPDSSWIMGSGESSTATDGIIVAGCVPKDAPDGTIYFFDVTVAEVGQLDPRAEVVHK